MSKLTRALAELAKRADAGDQAAVEGIRAYHGSPYSFDEFDFERMGSGVGAQVRGPGGYFSGNENYAEGFKKTTAHKGTLDLEGESHKRGIPLNRDSQVELMRQAAGDADPEKAARQLQNANRDTRGYSQDTLAELISDYRASKSGYMYEVNIDAAAEDFLNWDKPLSEQKKLLDALDDQYGDHEIVLQQLGLDVKYGDPTGGDLADALGMTRGTQTTPPKFLTDAGVKGVEYDFSGFPNYVVFDDKLISIAKKYGISIPAAAAVLAGTMTPEEAQAGPLSAGARRIIDPRFSQPVAGGSERKAVRGALETMQTDIDPRLMDVGSPVTLQDYEGYPYMLTQSDRSAAGGMLTGIHGQSIDPVNLQGGRDFMFDPQSGNLVWASDPNVVKTMYKRAMELRKKFGKDPILLPYTMAPTGIDFARMPLDTMINYARQGMSKANIKKLDSQIKKVIPGWTSVMDPEVNAMFRNVGGNQRKIIANIIDKNFRDVPGGLSMGEARAATSDIAQYTSPDGSLLNVGRIDTSQAPIADSGHSTYKGGLVGEGIGRLTEDLDVRPFMAARGRELTGGPEDIRSLSMNPAFSQGVVDEKLLRNIYDTQSGRLQEIATKYGVSIPVAAMALMGDAEEASASDIQANQGLVPFDKDIHTPRDVGFGGPSTEYTMTVDAPDGQVAVIPSIWWDTNGEPVVLDQRDAERRSFEYEQETGKQFPRFPAGDYELADAYAQARTRQGGASESPLASEYPSLGGMGVRMPPTAEDEEAMLAPTGGDLMQQANRDFVSSIRTQPEPDFLTGVQQSLLSGIMKTAGVADLSADVVSAMAGPLLSAPGAIARYAADRYVPGVNYSAEEMAQGRRETEDYFNYQPRTEQGQQYGEQIMQGIGGAIAPYVPAIKKAAGDSYILGAMRQGYDYLGEREKELAKALMDLSPI
jgi:hypothetical protein